MQSPRLEAGGWQLIGAFVLLEIAVLGLILLVVRLRRRIQKRGSELGSVLLRSDAGSGWILREIERLRAGEEPDEAIIKHLSLEDRALFEVSITDALNKGSREDQHRLRSAMIKCGYDEYCARRVMGEDISDRIRASALLALLRPQRRDSSIKVKPGKEGTAQRTRAARPTIGPLDSE